MRAHPFTHLTVKAKVALYLTLLSTLAIGFVTAIQLREIRGTMVSVLAAQDKAFVTRVADDLDEKFRLRRAALARTAAHLGPAQMQGLAPAQAALQVREALSVLFDHVFIISPQGKVLASEPFEARFVRESLAQRPYVQQAIATGKAMISGPYRSVADDSAFVMMSVPIFDGAGTPIGVLAGSITLLNPDFLGSIGATRLGSSGYLYVVTRGASPIYVSHPDKRKLMRPATDAARAHIGAMLESGAGDEGAGGERGEALLAQQSLKEIDWEVMTALSTEGAFGALAPARYRVVIFALLIALVIGAATWGLAYWLLRPLDALRDYVRLKREGVHPEAELPVRHWDEVGILTHEFNRLMRAQEAAKQALTANEARLRTITDNLPVLIAYLDREQRFRFNNRTHEEWFKVEQGAFFGRTTLEIFGAEAHGQIAADIEQALRGYISTGERELKLHGGTRVVHSTFMPDYGADNQVQGVYALAYDITAQKVIEQKLAFLAHHDTLTGLPNRGYFHDRLALALAKVGRSGKALALMYLDIDKFKAINDTYGHGAGDQLLKAFAQRLKDNVRGTDLAGRLGGDEFVVLAEDLASPDDAVMIAAKIVAAMRAPFGFDAMEIHASTSIGVAICAPGEEAISGAGLLERADSALYQAKQGGRDTYRVQSA